MIFEFLSMFPQVISILFTIKFTAVSESFSFDTANLLFLKYCTSKTKCTLKNCSLKKCSTVVIRNALEIANVPRTRRRRKDQNSYFRKSSAKKMLIQVQWNVWQCNEVCMKSIIECYLLKLWTYWKFCFLSDKNCTLAKEKNHLQLQTVFCLM